MGQSDTIITIIIIIIIAVTIIIIIMHYYDYHYYYNGSDYLVKGHRVVFFLTDRTRLDSVLLPVFLLIN